MMARRPVDIHAVVADGSAAQRPTGAACLPTINAHSGGGWRQGVGQRSSPGLGRRG